MIVPGPSAKRGTTIGFDGRYLRDACFGLGRYAHGLLTALGELEGDHRLVVFVDPSAVNASFPLDSLASRPTVELRSVSMPLHDPRELLAWRLALRRAPVDLFHAPYFLSPAVLPCPVVATVHDMLYDHYPQFLPAQTNPVSRHPARLLYKLTSRVALRRARRIIANSHSTRHDIAQLTHLAEDRIAVIPPGIDRSFRPIESEDERDRIRARYGLAGPFVLSVHGSRRPHKNLDRLIAAFQRVQADVPHTLVFVGRADPLFADPAAAAIAELKRAGRLIEIPHADEWDLPGLYSMADLLVQPSIFEGFGLPVLEAMACACPVACSDTGGLPEAGGDAAEYFDPTCEEGMAAAILRLLTSPARRQARRERGLQQAQRFSWKRAAEETMALYQEMVA